MGETVNKITSIFAQASADAVFDETKFSNDETMDKTIKTVKSALDKAHIGVMAKATAKPLHVILSEYCREDAIQLLYKNIKRYEKFINMTTPLTGRYVVYSSDPYADKSDEYIKADVKFTIFIVYFSAVVEEGSKTLLTEIFKRVIRLFKKDDNSESEDEICTRTLKKLGLKP